LEAKSLLQNAKMSLEKFCRAKLQRKVGKREQRGEQQGKVDFSQKKRLKSIFQKKNFGRIKKSFPEKL